MNRQESERARQIEREKALYRYSSALERGDFEAVAAVLQEAEQDPLLERQLLEMNQAYQAELEGTSMASSVQPQILQDRPPRWSPSRLLDWLRGQGQQKQGGSTPPARRHTGWRRWSGRLATAGVVLVLVLAAFLSYGTYADKHAGVGDYPQEMTDDGIFRSPVDYDESWDKDVVDRKMESYGGGGDSASNAAPPVAPEPGLISPEEPDIDEQGRRMIIRDGYITMVVPDTRAAQQSIEAMVAAMSGQGAYVISSYEYGGVEGEFPYITIVIRVPVERFDETMDQLANMADEVVTRSETGQDVTEEYVDLEAQLESLEAARQRLLEIMQEAETTEDLLQAEQQLTERERQIESIKGRMQYLSQSAQLSSITVELQPSILNQPVSTRWRPAEAARRALEGLVDGFKGLVDFLIFFAIAVLPWLALAGLILYGVVRLVRRRWEKRPS